jgi:hypothetical protein
VPVSSSDTYLIAMGLRNETVYLDTGDLNTLAAFRREQATGAEDSPLMQVVGGITRGETIGLRQSDHADTASPVVYGAVEDKGENGLQGILEIDQALKLLTLVTPFEVPTDVRLRRVQRPSFPVLATTLRAGHEVTLRPPVSDFSRRHTTKG